ncbi:amino acid ABC transporter permease [Qingrenia yutianensis]|uniref:Amino acid ABC transporter permease n=1 Tax=Qingrenia yutianensis TaxID=2763676 RepID=A0A926ITR3_9FIRM|nr:amino acid ABC transporter permease [Qingrenia yutianensis]MBC8596865.1 amino acid ABC transporter permease [Qingrenia yutianensis]
MTAFLKEVIDIAVKYNGYFLQGIGYTMLIALAGTLIGLVIGLITGIIRTIPTSKNAVVRVILKVVNFIISAYVEIFRGTPMMVQSMVIFWGYAFMNDGQTLALIPAGIFIVSINTGAYMAEIVRGGIISIDKGQFEGAYSVGMNHWQTMMNVIVPQAMRNILPAISNEFVINIKDTSVLNVIGVTELFFFTAKISKMTWAIFETYVVACVIYFVLTFTITRILKYIEHKIDGPSSYIIHHSSTMPDESFTAKEGAR